MVDEGSQLSNPSRSTVLHSWAYKEDSKAVKLFKMENGSEFPTLKLHLTHVLFLQ